jgi:small-conductance mechanosensitive channel
MANNHMLRLKLDRFTHREKLERVYFLVKLVVFLLLVYVRVRYPDFENSLGLPLELVESLLSFLTAYLIISLSRLILVYLYLKKNRQQSDFIDNFVLGINRIASLLTFFALIISVFLFFNIDLREFFTSISIVAAAIALLSKDYISNMINGMIIMFTDQLSLNDEVKIGEQKGKIVDITLINVHLLNDNEDLVYIPNSTVFTSNVINYTKYSVNKITMEFEMSRDQISTIRELEEYIRAGLNDYTDFLEKNSLHARVTRISKDYIQVKLQFVLLPQASDLEKEIRNQIAISILKYSDETRQMSKSL